MVALTTIPPEIIEEIILHLDPIEVSRVAQSSHFLHTLVYNPKDQALWRELYLEQPFDDPRKCLSPEGQLRTHIDWKDELQRIIRARIIVDHPPLCRPGEMTTILRTLIQLGTYVPPLTSQIDISCNLIWLAATLRGGLFLDERTDASEEERQLRARLHTYFGLTNHDARRSTRVRTRAFVYDLRNYRSDNIYGPFDADGHVNWVHVQALHHVVSMHIVDLQEDDNFEFAIFPMSLPYTQPVISHTRDLDLEEDWAGVTGTWTVSFCFCDHRELLRK